MDIETAHVFANLTTGIYVLTVTDGTRHHGMSSSWVTQVSGEPPLVMAAVDNRHHSRTVAARTGILGLNMVGVRSRALEDYFFSIEGGRPDNLDGLDYQLSPILGVPWLTLAMASIEARVTHTFGAGDHTLFVAEPVSVRINHRDRPLTSLDLDYVYIGGRSVVPRDRSGWS